MDLHLTDKLLKCPKHPGFKLEFMQVNEIGQNSDKDILYCCCCQDEDENYEQKNFILIHKLLEQGNSKILSKWPPLSDNKLLHGLINETKQNDQQYSLVQQINNFFDQFIKEFHESVEYNKKRMINLALKQPIQDTQILEKYQEVSKITELRNYLLDQKTDFQQKQAQCRQLIKQMLKEKEKNTQFLSNILSQHINIKNQINFMYPNTLKKSILHLINQINFFQMETPLEQKMQIETNNTCTIEKIMNLIQTKPNFCNEKFLSSVRSIINSINPLFDQLNNIEFFQPNKQPINFQQLRDYDLEIIRKQVLELEQKQFNQQPITFTQTQFNRDKQILSITKNQSILIKATTDTNYPGQCVSNIILDKEQKYIFRFKINCNVDRIYFDLGLIRDSEKDRDGFIDCLTYNLLYSSNQVIKSPFSSLSKLARGKDFIVKTNQQLIELRVCLQDKIFELVNYPNYDCKVVIDDYYKKNLNYHNLRLFIQTKSSQLEILLTDIFNVETFQD